MRSFRRFNLFLDSLVLISLGLGQLTSRQGEIIPLSPKVGLTIDDEENRIMGIFPALEGFQSAQFYRLEDDHYQVRIAYLDGGQLQYRYDDYSLRSFVELQNWVNSLPPITAQDRRALHENLVYLKAQNSIHTIPAGQLVVLKHTGGKRIRGTLLGMENDHYRIQTSERIVTVPFYDIHTIVYRPSLAAGHRWQRTIYAVTTLLGLGFSELWNRQSEPQADRLWHARFMGLTLGLLAGTELTEAFKILLTPRTSFVLSEEDRNNIKYSKKGG